MAKKQPTQKNQPNEARQRAPLKPAPETQYLPYFEKPKIEGFTVDVLSNKTYNDAVEWAKQILSLTRLPTSLTEIEAKGFREHVDIEWYAAAILRHWTFVWCQWSGGIPTDRIGRRNPIVFRGCVQTMESLIAELDRLITKAQILIDPISRSKRPGGIARRNQQRTKWTKYQDEANKIWAKNKRLSKNTVAEILHRTFPDVSVKTLNRRIKKPSS